MTYNQPLQPQKRFPWKPLLIFVALIVAICILGSLLTALLGEAAKPVKSTQPFPSVERNASAAAAPAVASQGGALTLKDVQLKIKVTKKQCFGSAGCSLEYQIQAATDVEKVRRIGDDWAVTYEVKGDESGTITGTIELHPDGDFSQDPFLTASTRSSGTKLSIKPVSIERL